MKLQLRLGLVTAFVTIMAMGCDGPPASDPGDSEHLTQDQTLSGPIKLGAPNEKVPDAVMAQRVANKKAWSLAHPFPDQSPTVHAGAVIQQTLANTALTAAPNTCTVNFAGAGTTTCTAVFNGVLSVAVQDAGDSFCFQPVGYSQNCGGTLGAVKVTPTIQSHYHLNYPSIFTCFGPQGWLGFPANGACRVPDPTTIDRTISGHDGPEIINVSFWVLENLKYGPTRVQMPFSPKSIDVVGFVDPPSEKADVCMHQPQTGWWCWYGLTPRVNTSTTFDMTPGTQGIQFDQIRLSSDNDTGPVPATFDNIVVAGF